ncbi:MAG: CpXC domain-containing protein, partial [Pseudomonadota bacterium]|nr:CpXC domain-containing protein [Pseudomonadota bacterium]
MYGVLLFGHQRHERCIMAVFHPYTVQCACGAAVTAQLADSINVRRSPEARERIMRGELHRAACAACGRQMTVEKAFYYTDFDRNALFKVFPKGERHGWKKASEDLDEASSYIPSGVAATEERTLRVVYGMDELREKLVAQDAGIDDRLLEIIKVLLVYEHPILLKWSRLRLVLQEVTETELRFHASYEHSQQVFRVDMPRRLLDEIQSDHKRIEEWTSKAHKTSIFALPDHWVNMWRWSPQPTALDRLQTYAAKINAGETIDTTSSTFKQMIAGLPRGRHLPPWA